MRAPLLATAAACVAILVLAIAWGFAHGSSAQYASTEQTTASVRVVPDANAAALASLGASASQMATSDVAMIGPAVVGALETQYQNLKQSGSYTPEAAAAAAQQLGEQVVAQVPFHTYTAADIKTESDTSYAGMLAYRAQLKDALAPIASLKDNELGIFAAYAQTSDPAELDKLRAVAASYAAAASSSAALVVPADAAALHASVLNALGQFGAVLEGLADNANDPITVITLLKTYQSAENDMISSFNNLAQYFAHHPKP